MWHEAPINVSDKKAVVVFGKIKHKFSNYVIVKNVCEIFPIFKFYILVSKYKKMIC